MGFGRNKQACTGVTCPKKWTQNQEKNTREKNIACWPGTKNSDNDCISLQVYSNQAVCYRSQSISSAGEANLSNTYQSTRNPGNYCPTGTQPRVCDDNQTINSDGLCSNGGGGGMCPSDHPYPYNGNGIPNGYCCQKRDISTSGIDGTMENDVCCDFTYNTARTCPNVICPNPPCSEYKAS